MKIPVEVQPPNQPNKALFIGEAEDDLTAEEVARSVGVPDDCLVGGKVIRSKKNGDRWSIVALIHWRAA